MNKTMELLTIIGASFIGIVVADVIIDNKQKAKDAELKHIVEQIHAIRRPSRLLDISTSACAQCWPDADCAQCPAHK